MNTPNDQKIAELENRVEKLEALFIKPATPDTRNADKKTSAKEFLMTKKPKTEVQKVLCLGYYLEYMESMPSFNVADLENVFRSAKEKLPSNINDAVNKNIARGMIMEAEEKKDTKKAWYLTSTGEKYVETELVIIN